MNLRQIKLVNDFVKDSKFFMVKIEHNDNGDVGKILRGDELINVDLKKHEVYRSIEYKNDNTLFVFDLKYGEEYKVKNPLSLLKSNLEEAKIIDNMYPNTFTWVYDGLSIKAYAIVPSGVNQAHSTISRYGGTTMFINILQQHLSNIGKMVRGISPDYAFLKNKQEIVEQELSIGSINLFTNSYSIIVNLEDDYMDIIKKSRNCVSYDVDFNVLDMKFWSREINPDFVVDSRFTPLENALPIDLAFVMYPQPIKKLMSLQYKGDEYRDLIARFLLSVHDNNDAKHIYYSVLGDDELSEVRKTGANKWNYSVNNYKKYGCPTNDELSEFINSDYGLNHPLEDIQDYFNKNEMRDEDE